MTRLLQNASNHQPFKDGPNMALNEWVEKAGDAIDKFLEKIVSSEGVASAPAPVNGARETNDAMVLKFVQLFVQHKVFCWFVDVVLLKDFLLFAGKDGFGAGWLQRRVQACRSKV